MSASISATAAYTDRLSLDQLTLRAIRIARRPKSVIWRSGPPSVGMTQMLVVAPSLSGMAIHRSSRDNALPVGYQGMRDAAYDCSRTPSPSGGLALKISLADSGRRVE